MLRKSTCEQPKLTDVLGELHLKDQDFTLNLDVKAKVTNLTGFAVENDTGDLIHLVSTSYELKVGSVISIIKQFFKKKREVAKVKLYGVFENQVEHLDTDQKLFSFVVRFLKTRRTRIETRLRKSLFNSLKVFDSSFEDIVTLPDGLKLSVSKTQFFKAVENLIALTLSPVFVHCIPLERSIDAICTSIFIFIDGFNKASISQLQKNRVFALLWSLFNFAAIRVQILQKYFSIFYDFIDIIISAEYGDWSGYVFLRLVQDEAVVETIFGNLHDFHKLVLLLNSKLGIKLIISILENLFSASENIIINFIHSDTCDILLNRLLDILLNIDINNNPELLTATSVICFKLCIDGSVSKFLPKIITLIKKIYDSFKQPDKIISSINYFSYNLQPLTNPIYHKFENEDGKFKQTHKNNIFHMYVCINDALTRFLATSSVILYSNISEVNSTLPSLHQCQRGVFKCKLRPKFQYELQSNCLKVVNDMKLGDLLLQMLETQDATLYLKEETTFHVMLCLKHLFFCWNYVNQFCDNKRRCFIINAVNILQSFMQLQTISFIKTRTCYFASCIVQYLLQTCHWTSLGLEFLQANNLEIKEHFNQLLTLGTDIVSVIDYKMLLNLVFTFSLISRKQDIVASQSLVLLDSPSNQRERVRKLWKKSRVKRGEIPRRLSLARNFLAIAAKEAKEQTVNLSYDNNVCVLCYVCYFAEDTSICKDLFLEMLRHTLKFKTFYFGYHMIWILLRNSKNYDLILSTVCLLTKKTYNNILTELCVSFIYEYDMNKTVHSNVEDSCLALQYSLSCLALIIHNHYSFTLFLNTNGLLGLTKLISCLKNDVKKYNISILIGLKIILFSLTTKFLKQRSICSNLMQSFKTTDLLDLIWSLCQIEEDVRSKIKLLAADVLINLPLPDKTLEPIIISMFSLFLSNNSNSLIRSKAALIFSAVKLSPQGLKIFMSLEGLERLVKNAQKVSRMSIIGPSEKKELISCLVALMYFSIEPAVQVLIARDFLWHILPIASNSKDKDQLAKKIIRRILSNLAMNKGTRSYLYRAELAYQAMKYEVTEKQSNLALNSTDCFEVWRQSLENKELKENTEVYRPHTADKGIHQRMRTSSSHVLSSSSVIGKEAFNHWSFHVDDAVVTEKGALKVRVLSEFPNSYFRFDKIPKIKKNKFLKRQLSLGDLQQFPHVNGSKMYPALGMRVYNTSNQPVRPKFYLFRAESGILELPEKYVINFEDAKYPKDFGDIFICGAGIQIFPKLQHVKKYTSNIGDCQSFFITTPLPLCDCFMPFGRLAVIDRSLVWNDEGKMRDCDMELEFRTEYTRKNAKRDDDDVNSQDWRIESSLFASRLTSVDSHSFFNQEIYASAFDCDWDILCQRDTFNQLLTKNLSDELPLFRKFLRMNYKTVCCIFKYYSSHGSVQESIDIKNAIQFIEDIQFLNSKFSKNEVERICRYIFSRECSEELLNKFQRQCQRHCRFFTFGKRNSLLRHGFLELIIRIVEFCFNGDLSIHTQEFFASRLCPLVHQEPILDSDNFRRSRLYDKQVDALLWRNITYLSGLFSNYAGVSGKEELGAKRGLQMTLAEFHTVLEGLGLFQTNFTILESNVLFKQSKFEVVNVPRNWQAQISLNLFDFIEALCRIADIIKIPTRQQMIELGVHNVQQFYVLLNRTKMLNLFCKDDLLRARSCTMLSRWLNPSSKPTKSKFLNMWRRARRKVEDGHLSPPSRGFVFDAITLATKLEMFMSFIQSAYQVDTELPTSGNMGVDSVSSTDDDDEEDRLEMSRDFEALLATATLVGTSIAEISQMSLLDLEGMIVNRKKIANKFSDIERVEAVTLGKLVCEQFSACILTLVDNKKEMDTKERSSNVLDDIRFLFCEILSTKVERVDEMMDAIVKKVNLTKALLSNAVVPTDEKIRRCLEIGVILYNKIYNDESLS